MLRINQPIKQKTIKNRLFQTSRAGTFGLTIVLVISLTAILAPFIAPHPPGETNTNALLLPPAWLDGGSTTYLLGTDNLGRDILSRVIYGSRVSLLVGIFSVIVAGVIGMTIGLISGYFGGFIDNLLMRIVEAFLAIPSILFILVILGVMGEGLLPLAIVIGLTSWVLYSRMIRSEVLSLKEHQFIKAAKMLGTPHFRIMTKHIIPNVFPTFIVVSTLSVASNIITESSLSFLGLGIQPPEVSWGMMLSVGRDYVATAWWTATFPGLAITITVLAIIFVGDWLRDRLDPHQQHVKGGSE